jgi:hypothetical protein
MNCRVYEVEGKDPNWTGGAVRCHREAVGFTAVGERSFPVCERHRIGFDLWVEAAWLYAWRDPEARAEDHA